MVDWDYFDKFEDITDEYMESSGEGSTMASQIVTAVCKLIYKWYNDGDVYDNTHHLNGWWNDLSSYANWLSKYAVGTADILEEISDAFNDDDYEDILKELADYTLDKEYLEKYECEKQGTIYKCDGEFAFEEICEDEEEDEW